MRIQGIAIAATLMTTAVQAQDVPAGEKIAQVWCSGCHQVNSGRLETRNDAVPSFLSVEQMDSTTATALAAFLSTSHGRMPDYSLSRIEIRNVSAYILSLRRSAVSAPPK